MISITSDGRIWSRTYLSSPGDCRSSEQSGSRWYTYHKKVAYIKRPRARASDDSFGRPTFKRATPRQLRGINCLNGKRKKEKKEKSKKMPPPNSQSNAPHADVILVKPGDPANEIITVGPGIKLEILEDGSRTDRRLAAVRVYLPPHTPGPAQHWHQMHDETFLVEKGTVTFTSRDRRVVARAGDYLVAPPCAPHTFANETDEEAVMYSTLSPAFYVDYLRLLATMADEDAGGKLTKAMWKEAMGRYATLQIGASEW